MPYSFILTLKRTNDAPLPNSLGEVVHAAFFKLLAGSCEEAGNALHALPERKPFTLYLLNGNQGAHYNRSEDDAHLRVTLLNDSLFAMIAGGLLACESQALHIGDAHFEMTGLLTHPSAHPLAGAGSYLSLWKDTAPAASVQMRFHTPSVFRFQKRDVRFPEPRLLWQSWARAWNQNAGLPDLLIDEPRVLALANLISRSKIPDCDPRCAVCEFQRNRF